MVNVDDLISLPFKDGARGPDAFDCWGLARTVYKRFGVDLPDYPVSAFDTNCITAKMESEAANWEPVKAPLPAPCLVAIRLDSVTWVNHVGVYIGNGNFIHAYKTTGVVIDKVKRWETYIVGFYVPRNLC